MTETSSNSYQERIAAKKERFAELAAKNREKSNNLYAENKAVLGCMNGTPILVGHHSEKRHRRELEKIDNRFRKSIECDDKAKYYEQKAQNIGQHGIASDDPEALAKLKAQLKSLEENHEFMKRANASFRKGGWNAITGLKEEQKSEIKHYMTYGNSRVPFPSYSLSNNKANINRLKKRIEELKKLDTIKDESYEDENFSYYCEDGRFCFSFPGIPDEETRKLLKSKAFKWSRYRKAWVRKITANASYGKQDVFNFLRNRGAGVS